MSRNDIPASEILEQSHVKVSLKGVKGERTKYKELAERLYQKNDIQTHRINAIQGSLNAALSNYQAASQGLKQLQAAQTEINDGLKEFQTTNGTTTADDTATEGE